MHKARLWANDVGKMGKEGDDIMFDVALNLIDAFDIEPRVAALFPDNAGSLFRDDAEFGHCIRGVGLDLKPDAIFVFCRPDNHHLRPGVAWNHDWSSNLTKN